MCSESGSDGVQKNHATKRIGELLLRSTRCEVNVVEAVDETGCGCEDGWNEDATFCLPPSSLVQKRLHILWGGHKNAGR